MEEDGGTLDPQIESSDDEIELEKLELDVNQMAEKISEYRSSLPDHLTSTLASILTAQRPVISMTSSFNVGSESGPSGHSDSGRRHVELGTGSVQSEEDMEYAEKIKLLKQKLSSNASAMPSVLKRMKDCISRVDKLNSCNGTVHPAFKRKRNWKAAESKDQRN